MHSLHNFQFTKRDLHVWKAFHVGSGRFIPRNKIVIIPQRKTELVEEIPFSLTSARRFASTGERKGNDNGNGDGSHEFLEPVVAIKIK